MKDMNLQDFACACSDLIWGGELGWDRENGLTLLFDIIRKKINKEKGEHYVRSKRTIPIK